MTSSNINILNTVWVDLYGELLAETATRRPASAICSRSSAVADSRKVLPFVAREDARRPLFSLPAPYHISHPTATLHLTPIGMSYSGNMNMLRGTDCGRMFLKWLLKIKIEKEFGFVGDVRKNAVADIPAYLEELCNEINFIPALIRIDVH